MCYNILADQYLSLRDKKKTQEQLYFPYCPREYQEYMYRYPLLMRAIPGMFDVTCSFDFILYSNPI
jgi:hypothetical protein